MTRERDPLDQLARLQAPPPSERARMAALDAAMAEFAAQEKIAAAPQGSGFGHRLISGVIETWRSSMTTKSLAGPALATVLLIPAAGLMAWHYMNEASVAPEAIPPGAKKETGQGAAAPGNGKTAREAIQDQVAEALEPADTTVSVQPVAPPAEQELAAVEAPDAARPIARMAPAQRAMKTSPALDGAALYSAPPAIMPEPMPRAGENRDRIEDFPTNPIRRVAEEPVSTFSIDVDTASYSLVRRMLKEGRLPEPDSVRVEELVNYFPYDWPAPESAETPFRPTVAVMPSPWHEQKLLMHVAIKGYEIPQQAKPKTNLVFLVDTSGSMQDADKLPLVKASLRLLLDRMTGDDTIALVTYAGEAGVALEPTKASERDKILSAIDRLGAGGSTAGAAGIEEAYRLAEKAKVEGGVNRIMLATDGDFNVGPSDDESLKKLVEEKRKSGVFLSVLGFGQGNYNDQLMQVLAQNGNGVAAYIDTLAEAEKTLVQEASASLFTIAKDVKIQVEFNPDRVSEYRLVGYETRALKREDFNNDRVDAGDIGSGHSVTAIYELTPKDSPAQSVDALRYQTNDAKPAAETNSGEFAFVKIRYKAPDGDVSTLIAQPVTEAARFGSLDQASDDVRFSVAVAGFGQKLRGADATAQYDWDRIAEIAQGARGADPFGYRSEFLTLVRLAKGLSGN